MLDCFFFFFASFFGGYFVFGWVILLCCNSVNLVGGFFSNINEEYCRSKSSLINWNLLKFVSFYQSWFSQWLGFRIFKLGSRNDAGCISLCSIRCNCASLMQRYLVFIGCITVVITDLHLMQQNPVRHYMSTYETWKFSIPSRWQCNVVLLYHWVNIGSNDGMGLDEELELYMQEHI